MTTVYLIRHSIRMPLNIIGTINTNQDKVILSEKIVLSSEGEKRAELLSKKQELQNIDIVYTSNCVRTIETAKYIVEKQKLKINIDERLNERKKEPYTKIKDFKEQFYNEKFKPINGESRLDVEKRFNEVFEEAIKKHKNKRIIFFSHGYAIIFFLLKYCKLVEVKDDETITLEYKGKIIFDKKLNAPEVFKITLNNDEIINIELIEFEDIKYNKGV